MRRIGTGDQVTGRPIPRGFAGCQRYVSVQQLHRGLPGNGVLVEHATRDHNQGDGKPDGKKLQQVEPSPTQPRPWRDATNRRDRAGERLGVDDSSPTVNLPRKLTDTSRGEGPASDSPSISCGP